MDKQEPVFVDQEYLERRWGVSGQHWSVIVHLNKVVNISRLVEQLGIGCLILKLMKTSALWRRKQNERETKCSYARQVLGRKKRR